MNFTKINKILKFPLFFLLSIISIIFPKDKRLWVFGAWYGQRYSDNSRYLFEYICKNEPDIRAVWLTRNKKIFNELRGIGKEVYLAKSLKSFFMGYRARVVFVSSDMLDVNPLACYGALKVQLWQGTPLKKIGLDDKISGNPDLPYFFNLLRFKQIK